MEKAAHYPEILDFILYPVSGLYLGLFSEGRGKCVLWLEIRVCMDLDGQGFRSVSLLIIPGVHSPFLRFSNRAFLSVSYHTTAQKHATFPVSQRYVRSRDQVWAKGCEQK